MDMKEESSMVYYHVQRVDVGVIAWGARNEVHFLVHRAFRRRRSREVLVAVRNRLDRFGVRMSDVARNRFSGRDRVSHLERRKRNG